MHCDFFLIDTTSDSSGGSGGGHGGSGGRGSRGKDARSAGLGYDSIYEPSDHGAPGGFGQMFGEFFIYSLRILVGLILTKVCNFGLKVFLH